MKRIVLFPDNQMPYHDKRAQEAVIRFIGEYQPDEVVHLGDLMDYPQPSRWSKDTAAEYQGSVFADSERAKKEFFEPLRDVYAGPVGVHVGNHCARPRDYLTKYAPALAESRAFDIDVLLDFDGFGVTRLPDFHRIAPGWVSTHGHLGGIRLSQNAGYTALNAAKKWGVSLVIGHVHRLAVTHYSEGYGQQVNRVLTGFEVGHLMNMKKAQYLKGGAANWQQGFGLLYIDGNHVTPVPVRIDKKRFVVEGEVFRV